MKLQEIMQPTYGVKLFTQNTINEILTKQNEP